MTKIQPLADTDKASERERITLLVCEALVNGASLAVACQRAGVPRSTFLYWMPRHPELQAQYREARALQVELLVDDVIALTVEARGATTPGEISAYRLQADALKWVICRLAPRVYNLAPTLPDPVQLAPVTPPTPVVVIKYDRPAALPRPRAMDGEVRRLDTGEGDE